MKTNSKIITLLNMIMDLILKIFLSIIFIITWPFLICWYILKKQKDPEVLGFIVILGFIIILVVFNL